MSRRLVGYVLLAVALVGVGGVVVNEWADDAPRPPATQAPQATAPEPGLLTWPARGGLSSDDVLVEAATDEWAAGRLPDGSAAPVPAGAAYVLWADTIGAGRVVLLQAVAADGRGLVAQVSEHGDPAVLELDAVAELPSSPPVALAVTYDGNLDLPGLEAGAGAALIQLLEQPPSATQTLALWVRPGTRDDRALELLDMRPDGMSETFLHLGAAEDPGTAVVVGSTVAGRSGIATTLEAHGDQLVPTQPDIVLADDAGWGPSGRIDGGEYPDALVAVDATGAAGSATVREVAFGLGDVRGAEASGRLVEVDPGGGAPYLVLVGRFTAGDVVCVSVEERITTDELVAQQCNDAGLDVLVAAFAAADGRGAVRLSGTNADGLEPTARVVVVGPVAGQRAPLVGALVDDPTVTVTLPPPG